MVINPIIGFYIPIIRIPIKGGMTIPNIATFDHGTDGFSSRSATFFPWKGSTFRPFGGHFYPTFWGEGNRGHFLGRRLLVIEEVEDLSVFLV